MKTFVNGRSVATGGPLEIKHLGWCVKGHSMYSIHGGDAEHLMPVLAGCVIRPVCDEPIARVVREEEDVD